MAPKAGRKCCVVLNSCAKPDRPRLAAFILHSQHWELQQLQHSIIQSQGMNGLLSIPLSPNKIIFPPAIPAWERGTRNRLQMTHSSDSESKMPAQGEDKDAAGTSAPKHRKARGRQVSSCKSHNDLTG